MTSQKSSIDIISWNVNGLRACRKKTFDQFVAQKNPDLLCLQEVKLNKDVIPDDDFGYPIDIITWLKKKVILEPQFFPKLNLFQLGKIFRMANM